MALPESYEQQIAHRMFNQNNERSYIDKVIAKDEVSRLRELISHETLTRKEINEIFNLLVGTESKLVSYNPYERYVLLKYHVWVREFVKHADSIAASNEVILKNYEIDKSKITETHYMLIKKNTQIIQGAIKQLIEVYLNIARTSLSVGTKGFTDLITNKNEVIYPQQQGSQIVEQKKRWFGMGNR